MCSIAPRLYTSVVFRQETASCAPPDSSPQRPHAYAAQAFGFPVSLTGFTGIMETSPFSTRVHARLLRDLKEVNAPENAAVLAGKIQVRICARILSTVIGCVTE